ncbi:MAG: hypothetical protein ACRD7E_10025, partial [Bryobacteraceae bacterium]
LKGMFFGPLKRIIEARHDATEGARRQAADALARAEAHAEAYEEQIRAARNDLYKEQEELRRQWRDQQSAQVQESRQRAEAMVNQAKEDLAGQAAAARETLADSSQSLASEITEIILQRKTI